MDNWFTIEQIDRDTFSISEYKHWEETHCYLLCGEKYAILIDTGLGVSNIRKIVDSLTKLPVMTVTTHVHWDHIGGHKYFDMWLSLLVSHPKVLKMGQHIVQNKGMTPKREKMRHVKETEDAPE